MRGRRILSPKQLEVVGFSHFLCIYPSVFVDSSFVLDDLLVLAAIHLLVSKIKSYIIRIIEYLKIIRLPCGHKRNPPTCREINRYLGNQAISYDYQATGLVIKYEAMAARVPVNARAMNR